MENVSLSEQLQAHDENRARHQFAKQVDVEAQTAEREAMITFIERRVAFLNSRGQVGDTFRVDELLTMESGIKAGKHTEQKQVS